MIFYRTLIISNKKIAIYSDQFQEYSILEQKDEGNDGLGYFKDYSAIDQDGKSCIVKLRVQKEGSIRQICIYQKEEAWADCLRSRTTN